ncbi:uncharacterized protein LOC141849730 [Brevipalpus obovatus]|uniref:uncharacterized protein LOC141849730 n=1 Tax=Brevipalpus obovatus TaxID=246614 RepID=UPI003D9ED7BF
MWTYADVHIYLTLPIILFEWLLLRPFLNVFDTLKVVFVCAMALIYTIPWDNYIVYHNAWSYPGNRVLGVIGWVPYEEYAFFIIQTVLTLLWTTMLMRWRIPCLFFNCNKRSYSIIRWIPMLVFIAAASYGAARGIPGTKTFYIGSLFWWIFPVITFMWYGAGNYLVQRGWSSLISIVVPTAYLWWVDIFSMSEGIWHIEEAASLEIFPVNGLPIEEALFFFFVNTLIVLAYCAFDKAKTIIDLHPDRYPVKPSLSSNNFFSYMKQLFLAFLATECALPKENLDDLKVSISVLEKGSKSFTAAASAFDSGIRIDLSILYGFARVTDDMIDEEPDQQKKIANLDTIKKFLDTIFAGRGEKTWTYDIAREIDPRHQPQVNWQHYKKCLTDEQFRSFRALSRIVYYLPSEPFYELCRGYRWDIDNKEVVTEEDLLEYSSYVASSIGTLCVFIICYKSGRCPDAVTKSQSNVIDRAREMGQVLQIVNISRDIVTDSLTMGRCYVPSIYFEDREKELKVLREKRDPWTLGEKKLKSYAIRMLDLADKYASQALRGVPMLPSEVQAPVLATTEIYRMIGGLIAKYPGYNKRAFVSKPKKILVALTCMYTNFMHSERKFRKLHSD